MVDRGISGPRRVFMPILCGGAQTGRPSDRNADAHHVIALRFSLARDRSGCGPGSRGPSSIRPGRRNIPVKTKLGFYLAPSGKRRDRREKGRFYLHEDRPHRIVFASEKKLDRLKIAFGSETEDFETRVRFFDLPLTEGRTTRRDPGIRVRAEGELSVPRPILSTRSGSTSSGCRREESRSSRSSSKSLRLIGSLSKSSPNSVPNLNLSCASLMTGK